METASGLAAGLAEPTDDGLEPAAGLVVRLSALAALKASFSFFSDAGLKALGVPAGLYVDALLSRFAVPIGLKGLAGADV